MYLTLKEVADILRWEPETVRLKFASGRIPGAFKLDDGLGEWRIAESDLKEWIRGRMKAGAYSNG